MIPERRGRRTRQLAWTAFALAATIGAFLVWRATSLGGLPDIGDPFDVAAFTAVRVPDDRNAFVLYRAALEKYQRLPRLTSPVRGLSWSGLDPAQKAWLPTMREAMDLWRLGTERPDSEYLPVGQVTLETIFDPLNRIRDIADAATLEGSRLDALGDHAGAWAWYRAVLRSSRHYGRHGTLIEWNIGASIHGRIAAWIGAWSSLPGVDAALLRTVLADVQAIDRLTPRPSDVLKYEYLNLKQYFSRPDEFLATFAPNIVYETSPRWRGVRTKLLFAGRHLSREPERSIRVARLILANWLAYCDRPLADQPPARGPNPALYETAPGDQFPGSDMPRDRLREWYESTLFLKAILGQNQLGFFANQRKNQAKLVIRLASELYAREHGAPPDSPQALIGTYLDTLPEGSP